MRTLSQQIETLLLEQKTYSRLRQLKTTTTIGSTEILVNGKVLINFASNDYLGLSQHPWLKQRAIEAIEKYGVGSPSSRLIAGNCELYDQIEAEIARLKGTDTAVIFPTGFQTNLSIMLALSKLNTLLFADRLSHNSILLGAQWNRHNFQRFAHNDIADLIRLINNESATDRTIWVVTESVFSMGDLAPTEEFISLAERTNIHLYIDEAHATGVFGKNGMGMVHSPGNQNVVMGTFGKGCGSFGAYVACSDAFKNFLVNFCPGIIYTTALPPPVLGAIQGALDLIPHMASTRQQLLEQAWLLKSELLKMGFKTGDHATQIIYLSIGDDEKTLLLSQYLAENNIYAPAIRPPTVPANAAGIRLSLSAAHKEGEIEHLIKTLKRWHEPRY